MAPSAAALVALLTGMMLTGGGASEEELDAAEAATVEALGQHDEVRAELDRVNEQVDELEAGHRDEIGDLRRRLTDAESARDAAVETAREELEEERDAVLAEAEQEGEQVLAAAEEDAEQMLAEAEDDAEEMLAEAQGRVSALDEREADLDARSEELDVLEERQAANTFGNGVHVVGEDIEPGTYRTDGGSTCYWARLSGLSGGFDDLTANGLPDGPATVEIRSSDAGFESSGCGEWTRTN